MIKNHGSILRPDIRTLSIQRCRIVIRPENIEQLIIADLRGIEFELENLCMPSFIRANVLVAWVLFGPARIADRGRRHALQFPKSFFHAPKTTGPECGFLGWHGKQSNENHSSARRSLFCSFVNASTRLVDFAIRSPAGSIIPSPTSARTARCRF